MSNYNVLVVDDEKEIRDAIEVYLRTTENINIIKASDGLEALDALNNNEIHVIILDVMMPKLDGIRTCVKIRESKNIPIIMLSAKSEDTDKILGLNIGADDYITKPFNPLELIARVKSQLRRYIDLGNCPNNVHDDEIIIDELAINKATHIVTLYGNEIKLTPIEYEILLLLAENRGRVFPSKEIYERVWNEPAFRSENTVSVHIRRLRKKIEINTKEPRYIKVVWGVGYKIEK
ncbi:DNA-binding response OmpR family regulator [Clostridium tetanomorphum]|uniref:Stage 0 sporulation protein A homolog n=1 Tax=Clostridium tetanomorphum TaxID=1553 RepID=A0A923EE83_CLOTT|nr:response regulator transcription factor [Clostridium tetanomorphum]KAJ48850.1 DNA-binding response regulator [Clostridium tetanomorphum DSM 665]KAJ50103.1 DNA-binding response regulator [Clostridium tetanomorphum DSM 665]MBC2399228.1 response regulator transcription factor [Clostridium tetanomorphum]MBP1862848.1 DNA-binding response OmpR family regulator [Clostridium tetanomorphum]NRS86985.1 DNA-binding response OmpR family regulator [Clostridium tetanomorphum]